MVGSAALQITGTPKGWEMSALLYSVAVEQTCLSVLKRDPFRIRHYCRTAMDKYAPRSPTRDHVSISSSVRHRASCYR